MAAVHLTATMMDHRWPTDQKLADMFDDVCVAHKSVATGQLTPSYKRFFWGIHDHEPVRRLLI